MNPTHTIPAEEEGRKRKKYRDKDPEAKTARVEEEERAHTEEELDHGLKETFPASDPVWINPGAD